MNRDFKGVWLPKEIYLHKGLTPTEKLLLAEINSFSTNGVCFASNEHFAEFLGVSKNHVSKLISKLSKMGFVSIEITFKEDSKEVDKRFITPIHSGIDPLIIEEDTPIHSGIDPLLVNDYYKEQEKEQPKEQEKKKINKKNVPNSEYEAEFETLWGNYPKKVGKKKALSSYIKARKVNKYTYETIKLGLERYIRHLEEMGKEYEFIKDGKTWFNSEGWNDDYTPPKLNRKPKSLNEYLKQKNGGGDFEQTRSRKIVDLYPQDLPEPFQGL
jgi:hypothetical protein